MTEMRAFLCETTSPTSQSRHIVWHDDPAVVAAFHLNDESDPTEPATIKAAGARAMAKRGDVVVDVRPVPTDLGPLDDDKYLSAAKDLVKQYCVRHDDARIVA